MRSGLVTIRTSQPSSDVPRSHYSNTLISYQGQGPSRGHSSAPASRLQGLSGPDDDIERASRVLAKAFGYGDSWFTGDFQFGPTQDWRPTRRRTGDGDENLPAAFPGLSIARRTETLERADRAAGVGEFHHWQRARGIAVMPRVRPKTSALGSLAFAKLDGPLEDWLLMYALQDWSRWPKVKKYAELIRPDPPAIQNAAERILFRKAAVSQDTRAAQLMVRASAYRARTQTAEVMLREWLHRAAERVLST